MLDPARQTGAPPHSYELSILKTAYYIIFFLRRELHYTAQQNGGMP